MKCQHVAVTMGQKVILNMETLRGLPKLRKSGNCASYALDGEKCFHSICEAVRFQLVMVNSKRSETHFLSGVVSSKLKPGRM